MLLATGVPRYLDTNIPWTLVKFTSEFTESQIQNNEVCKIFQFGLEYTKMMGIQLSWSFHIWFNITAVSACISSSFISYSV